MASRVCRSAIFLALCGAALTGCGSGFIYTDVVDPYCWNMTDTPRGMRSGSLDTRQLKIPIRAPGLQFNWNSNAIADAARAGKITEIAYCDVRTFSLLGGIWKQQNIVVYGR